MRRTIAFLSLAAAIGVPFSAALADRDPTPEERTQIERVLRTEGFSRWDEIEFEDAGHWEVDDAVAADGRKYDLKLNATFAIIERKLD